jgi:hypothetical protein
MKVNYVTACIAMSNSAMVAGQLKRAAVELAKQWRLDKYLRRLDVRERLSLFSGLLDLSIQCSTVSQAIRTPNSFDVHHQHIMSAECRL